MKYPKPKRRKGNKNRHISNERITEYIPCNICKAPAVETHEIYYGDSYLRNTSMKYKAQIKVCKKCHTDIHAGKHQQLKQEFQYRLMEKHDFTEEEFRRIFYKNYLGVKL